MDKLEADYNMFDWWKKVFIKNYTNFNGRARRLEFWYFHLVNLIIAVCFTMFNHLLEEAEGSEFSSIVASALAIFYLA